MSKLRGKIDEILTSLFDKVRERFVGIRKEDKKIVFMPNHTADSVLGVATGASIETGGKITKPSLKYIATVADAYVDKAKDHAVDRIMKLVNTGQIDKKDLPEAIENEWKSVTDKVDLIMETAFQRGVSLGSVEGISLTGRLAGEDDPVVGWMTRKDNLVCEQCKGLYLLPDKTTPRVWKMSEISSGFRKKDDPTPSTSGAHPRCRCQLFRVPSGWGFKDGSLAFISMNHDEFAHQRENFDPVSFEKSEKCSCESCLGV